MILILKKIQLINLKKKRIFDQFWIPGYWFKKLLRIKVKKKKAINLKKEKKVKSLFDYKKFMDGKDNSPFGFPVGLNSEKKYENP